MKKWIPFLMLGVGVSVGAIFHAPIVSLFDGIHEIPNFEQADIPPGFRISPADASFIVVNLKQGMHWGMYNALSVHVDSQYYYVVSPRDASYRPHPSSPLSQYAKDYGYCVNGQTGAIRRWNEWENVGFLLMSLEDLRGKFPLGTPQKVVTDTIGWGHEGNSQSNREWRVVLLRPELDKRRTSVSMNRRKAESHGRAAA